MALLNAFLATWSHARQTFGEGTPEPGERFDASTALRRMQADVEGAAPGDSWQGGAANAYAAANAEHAEVFGKLADLDTRLAAEVDNSAQVVTTGRSDLDRVHDWVVSAAAAVPNNRSGDTIMMSIVSKGLSEVTQIVERSNGELTTIAGRLRRIGGDYEALSNQRFAGKNRAAPEKSNLTDDDPPYDPKPTIDAGTWRLEMEKYDVEVTAHNAAVAAHARTPAPPANSPLYPAYLARAQALNAQRNRLEAKRIELTQQAAELGLPPPEFTPPPDFGGLGVRNAVPDRVGTVRPAGHTELPG